MLTTPAVPYGSFSVTKIPFSEYWEEAELSAEQCWVKAMAAPPCVLTWRGAAKWGEEN